MKLSVIIPTRNRASLTAALLDSLAQLDPVPWEWEVIVVDNGSTDNTALLVKQKQDELPILLRYVLEERPGLHQGRHRGAFEAKGKYLAYLDDDMLLAPTWLQGIAMLEEGKADAVVGRIVPKWEITPPEWLNHLCASGVFGPLALLDLGDYPVETIHFYGCNLFIPRQTVFDFGGFHPDGMPDNLLHYRGDGESGLWMKMRIVGKTLWYSPTAIAYHIVPQSRMTVEYMQKRSFNQGVSQSFTDIRSKHGLYENEEKHLCYIKGSIKGRISKFSVLLFIRYFFGYIMANSHVEREIVSVRYKMAKKNSQGWDFHSTALKNDNTLKAYTIKQSYL